MRPNHAGVPVSDDAQSPRLDVMALPLKTLPALALALALSSAAGAQTAGDGKAPPGGVRRSAAGEEEPRPRPRPAAEPAPAPVAQPMASLTPLAEEAQHVARYDAAIAPARDRPVSPR